MEMARIVHDGSFYNECQSYFKKGQRSFEKELWRNSYYIAGKSKKEKYIACTAGQLNGQWYAHLLDLGYILPEKHVKKAVKTMLDLNGKKSRYGIVNSVYPDGRIDRASYHAENIWTGETYALASLAIYEGYIKEGLDVARRTWENFVYRKRNVWSQPDVVFARDGSLGDGELYVRNMSVWTIPFALARHDKRVKNFLLELEPKLEASLP